MKTQIAQETAEEIHRLGIDCCQFQDVYKCERCWFFCERCGDYQPRVDNAVKFFNFMMCCVPCLVLLVARAKEGSVRCYSCHDEPCNVADLETRHAKCHDFSTSY